MSLPLKASMTAQARQPPGSNLCCAAVVKLQQGAHLETGLMGMVCWPAPGMLEVSGVMPTLMDSTSQRMGGLPCRCTSRRCTASHRLRTAVDRHALVMGQAMNLLGVQAKSPNAMCALDQIGNVL